MTGPWTAFCAQWAAVAKMLPDPWAREFIMNAGGVCKKCKHVRLGLKHADKCLPKRPKQPAPDDIVF